MLRNILRRNLNSPVADNNLNNPDYLPNYLKEAILTSYPELFKVDTQENAERYKKMLLALGSSFKVDKFQSELFNPHSFDAEKLDELYKLDKNPIWRVLKSIKPIDTRAESHFSAHDKLHSLYELADDLKNKKLGKKNMHNDILNLAKEAMALANTHPQIRTEVEQKFGLQSGLGKWLMNNAKKENKITLHNSLLVTPITMKRVENLVKDPDNPSFKRAHWLDNLVVAIIERMSEHYSKGGLSTHFFSTIPIEKINHMITAYNALDMDDRIKLTRLNEMDLKSYKTIHELGKASIGKFLLALQENQGLSKEANSFKEFKNELAKFNNPWVKKGEGEGEGDVEGEGEGSRGAPPKM